MGRIYYTHIKITRLKIHEHSGMTWGATLIVPQAMEWGISADYSATSMNYGMLLQGVGGLVAIPLIEAFGWYVYIYLWFVCEYAD